MSGIISGVGRALIALLFIASGAAKLLTAHAIETTIAVAGLARQLVIPSGVFELIAGLCLAFGIATRLVSLLLIVFLVVATAAMGNPMADPLLLAVGLRNLAIIGGLLGEAPVPTPESGGLHVPLADADRAAELEEAVRERVRSELGGSASAAGLRKVFTPTIG